MTKDITNRFQNGISSAILNDLIEEKLANKGALWLNVLSGSMVPLIPIGSKILIKHISSCNIYLGDIIVFKNGDKLIVHRIFGKYQNGEDTFFLQGGDNYSQPSKMHKNAIMGKVLGIHRNSGLIRMDNFRGRLLNIYFTLVSIIKYRISKLLFHIKERSEKTWIDKFLCLCFKAIRVPLTRLSNSIVRLLINYAEKQIEY